MDYFLKCIQQFVLYSLVLSVAVGSAYLGMVSYHAWENKKQIEQQQEQVREPIKLNNTHIIKKINTLVM